MKPARNPPEGRRRTPIPARPEWKTGRFAAPRRRYRAAGTIARRFMTGAARRRKKVWRVTGTGPTGMATQAPAAMRAMKAAVSARSRVRSGFPCMGSDVAAVPGEDPLHRPRVLADEEGPELVDVHRLALEGLREGGDPDPVAQGDREAAPLPGNGLVLLCLQKVEAPFELPEYRCKEGGPVHLPPEFCREGGDRGPEIGGQVVEGDVRVDAESEEGVLHLRVLGREFEEETGRLPVAEKDVVRPLDEGPEVEVLPEGSCHRDGRGHGHHEDPVDGNLRREDGGRPYPARGRGPGPAEPSLPPGLLLGDDHHAVEPGRVLLAQEVPGDPGGGLGGLQVLHPASDDLRPEMPLYLVGKEPGGSSGELIQVLPGFSDGVPEVAEPVHRLAHPGPGDTQGGGEGLGGGAPPFLVENPEDLEGGIVHRITSSPRPAPRAGGRGPSRRPVLGWRSGAP